ncbi:MAG: FtsW/RodA/SpoVE family cell cycle protein [Candidatus Saccharibacteria bacterium]
MSRPETRRIVDSLSENKQTADLVLSRKHRPDYLLVLYMGLLMMLGLIIIYAIGPQRANVLNNAYGSNYNDIYFFSKQAASLAIAIAAFVFMSLTPFIVIAKRARGLVLLALGACLLLAVAGWTGIGIAKESLGATRWFEFGSLGGFQPSELLKFAILIFGAMFLGNKIRQGKLNDIWGTLAPLGVIYAISMIFIVIIQKDLGTGIALTGIIATMLFIGKISVRRGLVIFGILATLGIATILAAPHRVERIMTFFQGDSSASSTSDDENYHIEHAKLAIGSGGLFGVGVGNSVQATGYLPEAINDSVFAIMGEVFGFVGLVLILALFVALLMRLLKIIDHLADVRLKLLVAGVFGWLGSHVILNVASMTGIVPLTGITLPLLSFGGTSMAFIAAALGLTFQLSRYTVHPSSIKEVNNEDFSSRRGIGRSRHSSRSGFGRS